MKDTRASGGVIDIINDITLIFLGFVLFSIEKCFVLIFALLWFSMSYIDYRALFIVVAISFYLDAKIDILSAKNPDKIVVILERSKKLLFVTIPIAGFMWAWEYANRRNVYFGGDGAVLDVLRDTMFNSVMVEKW